MIPFWTFLNSLNKLTWFSLHCSILQRMIDDNKIWNTSTYKCYMYYVKTKTTLGAHIKRSLTGGSCHFSFLFPFGTTFTWWLRELRKIERSIILKYVHKKELPTLQYYWHFPELSQQMCRSSDVLTQKSWKGWHESLQKYWKWRIYWDTPHRNGLDIEMLQTSALQKRDKFRLTTQIWA